MSAAAKPEATIGVGDGPGQLFVHGSHEAVKRVQSIILEAERLQAEVARLSPSDEETRYTADQDWTGLDGMTAYWLIDRHGDGWAGIGAMMEAWRDAEVQRITAELRRERDDLTTMVIRLIRRMRAARESNGTGDSDDLVEQQCLDYLRRKGLTSPLRARPAPAAAPEQVKPRFAPCGRSAGTCGRSTHGCGRQGCQADTSEPTDAELVAAEWPEGFEQAVQRLPKLADAVALFDGPAQAKPCRCRRCLTERGDLLTLASTMIVCPTCGNKRCPHATDHRHACTGSNEPGQTGSWYGGMPERAEPAGGCGACGDACRSRGSCRLADESPQIEPVSQPLTALERELVEALKAIIAADDLQEMDSSHIEAGRAAVVKAESGAA